MDMLRSEVSVEEQARYLRRGDYARVTAADRPGVAQPVPVREVPQQPWGRVIVGVFVLFALLLGSWEWYWRDFGVTPGIRNTDGLWAIQRRRIDAGEGDVTVLLGSSRIYFDTQLPVWQKLAGKRPIQLAFEGTTPLVYLDDLAADPKFTSRVLIGVAPDLFFSGFAYRGTAAAYTHKESPSQRIGQWLSMRLIEPVFAFYDPDFALHTVLSRQPWPNWFGKKAEMDVRKLAMHEADRATHLWGKVASDPDYRAIAQKVWLQEFEPNDDMPTPDKLKQMRSDEIARAVKDVVALRARGVKVLFVRPPSTGPYLEFENKVFPRAQTWDALLAATAAPGIHFEDYPELQGFYMPEWSHMTQAEGERFTAILYKIIARDFWPPETPATAAH